MIMTQMVIIEDFSFLKFTIIFPYIIEMCKIEKEVACILPDGYQYSYGLGKFEFSFSFAFYLDYHLYGFIWNLDFIKK